MKLAFPLVLLTAVAVGVVDRAYQSSDALAFAVQSEAGSDIILIDAHTLEWYTVGSNAGGEGYLNWLPDGRSIIYGDGLHIYRLSVVDGEITRLTQSADTLHSAPSLSPDGKTIAYLRSRGFYPEIWLMNVDGRSPRALSRWTIYGGRPPAWSPDGERVGIVINGPDSSDTAVIRVRYNDLTNITADSHLNDDIAWSPDGQQVAYMSAGANGSGYQLDVHDLRTDAVQTVAKNAAFVGRASWSPDGSQFVFIMREPRGAYHLYSMDWPDGKIHRLITDRVAPSWLSWSPDGSRLALVAVDRQGIPTAHIVDVGFRVAMPLTPHPSLYLNPPMWRPDPAHTPDHD